MFIINISRLCHSKFVVYFLDSVTLPISFYGQSFLADLMETVTYPVAEFSQRFVCSYQKAFLPLSVEFVPPVVLYSEGEAVVSFSVFLVYDVSQRVLVQISLRESPAHEPLCLHVFDVTMFRTHLNYVDQVCVGSVRVYRLQYTTVQFETVPEKVI